MTYRQLTLLLCNFLISCSVFAQNQHSGIKKPQNKTTARSLTEKAAIQNVLQRKANIANTTASAQRVSNQNAAGLFWGVSPSGGDYGGGVVFSYDPSTGAIQNHYSFVDMNTLPQEFGSIPVGPLTLAPNGKLYGATMEGGKPYPDWEGAGYGTVYNFDPVSKIYEKVHDFGSDPGLMPASGLILASNGLLYGTTSVETTGIFSVNPSNNAFTTVTSFPRDQGNARGRLTEATPGVLYGTLLPGRYIDVGSIFKYEISTGIRTILYQFPIENDFTPLELTSGGNGKLYWVYGESLFEFDPITNDVSQAYEFDLAGGKTPYSSLKLASDGKIYGTTKSGGDNGLGVIFSFDAATKTYAKVYSSGSGEFFHGAKFEEANSKLWGVPGEAGPGGVFSFDPATSNFNKEPGGTSPAAGSSLTFVSTCGGTEEICNGVDDDCDGQIDEGVKSVFYRDRDLDGYGDPLVTIEACAAPEGYVSDKTDCDDTKATVHPGATEICGNNIDDNCNGQVDENCETPGTDPQITVANIQFSEGTSSTDYTDAVFTFTLNKVSSVPVKVSYVTEDNTALAKYDYLPRMGTITIPANTLSYNLVLSIKGDKLSEGSENFLLKLSSPVNATLTVSQATATILDDDALPAVRVYSVKAQEGYLTAPVRVTLSVVSGKTVTVKLNTKDSTAVSPDDFTALNDVTVTFLPGERSKSVPVTLKTDNLKESHEYFIAVLSEPENATLAPEQGGIETAVLIITNTVSTEGLRKIAQGADRIAIQQEAEKLAVKVFSNPSSVAFQLNIDAMQKEKVRIRVSDLSGRIVEQRVLQPGSQQLRLGDSWPAGTYIVELTQGSERKNVKLMKLK